MLDCQQHLLHTEFYSIQHESNEIQSSKTTRGHSKLNCLENGFLDKVFDLKFAAEKFCFLFLENVRCKLRRFLIFLITRGGKEDGL